MSKPAFLGIWLALMSSSALGTTFEIRPVSATSAFILAGDEILLPQGLPQPTVITFDVFVSGWSPALFRGAQFWQLVSGGSGGSITPFNPACTLGPQCDQLVGPFGDCIGTKCGFGFFESTRSDFIFLGSPFVTGSNLEFAGLATEAADSVSDPAVAKYLASFRMQVAPDSGGTFTVSFDLSSFRTFWMDDAQSGFIPTITPARVTFNSVAFGLPAVSTWGLLVLGLAVACAATIRLGRLRAAA